MKKTIHLAHSPDSDDAFMFFALATGRINTGEYDFVHQLDDIETLNKAAEEGLYEVTALSIHAYACLSDRYALMNCGASMGEGYGPILVAKRGMTIEDLRGRRIAIPGLKTSAFLAMKLLEPDFVPVVMSFDRIDAAVVEGQVDAGLLIHEGQLSYSDEGLQKVVDLGEWWRETTGLPLPLGGNAIRRDLGEESLREVTQLVEQSIRYGLEHREDALNYALEFGRGLDEVKGDRFVSMYVNARTLDYGPDGRKAVQLFLDRGFEAGLLPNRVEVEFI
jgi:1,4-dihydroxy-6-naphthoate synthase